IREYDCGNYHRRSFLWMRRLYTSPFWCLAANLCSLTADRHIRRASDYFASRHIHGTFPRRRRSLLLGTKHNEAVRAFSMGFAWWSFHSEPRRKRPAAGGMVIRGIQRIVSSPDKDDDHQAERAG